MSAFLSELKLKYVGKNDEEKWELLEPFEYQSDVAGITITVPAGYITDLASVPRFPLAYWLTGGKAKLPSIPHDYLCETKIVSREMADQVFLEACEVAGMPGWRRSGMWTAVRLYSVFSGADAEAPEKEKKPIKPEDLYFG